MTDELADALVETYVNAMELLGVALRIIRARDQDDPIADELVSVCPEAVRFCRAFRRDELRHLPFYIEQVRRRFVAAEELLLRLRVAGHPGRSDVTAAIEIAERGRVAAVASAEILAAGSGRSDRGSDRECD